MTKIESHLSQAGPELLGNQRWPWVWTSDPPASASQILGMQAFTTTPVYALSLIKNILIFFIKN